jgi:peptidoglycan/LPS O-acetylase OafA/YrhL
MLKSGKSVFYFGIYLLLIGMLLFFISQQFISTLKLPDMPGAWARLLGVLVFILGCYYIIGGKNNLLPFIKATVYLRLFFLACTLVLFATGQMPKEILPFGVIDMLGALWTQLSLKKATVKM